MKLQDLLKSISNRQQNHQLLQLAHQYAKNILHHPTNLHARPLLEQGLHMAKSLAQIQLHTPTLAAALLHNIPTLPQYQQTQLAKAVSSEVANLVQQTYQLQQTIQKLQHITPAFTLRKTILTSTKDLRIILILLAERLYLLKHADKFPAKKLPQLVQECRSIYAPIAHRLGVDTIKNQLEDQSFALLEPKEYQHLHQQSEHLLKLSQQHLQQLQIQLQQLLKKSQIPAEISGRTKSLSSIRKKVQNQNIPPKNLHDLTAIRIIVPKEETCYQVLQLIHQSYQPLPGRFKDYIALPKPNGYQSLHTTILNEQQPIEIQIRTNYMHRWAEVGIAAHFAYKETSSQDPQELDSILWFRSMVKNITQQLQQTK